MIRPATIKDGDAIERLWRHLVEYHVHLDNNLPGEARNGARRYARRLVERLDDTQTHTLVAEENGQVVGFALGAIVDLIPDVFDQEPSGFLADIYVDEAYRGQGIGRALVEAMTDWFRKQGVRYFEWNVAARNPDARAFWQAVGGQDVMVRMRAPLKDNE
jgi:GNAT superfamily N-acetyltransferase